MCAVRLLGICWLLASAACMRLEPTCDAPPAARPDDAPFRVLSWNVGNGDKTAPYSLRIRDRAYERFVGEQIRGLEPDVVFLQEVLGPDACASFVETREDRTCAPDLEPANAAQRLLGPDYSVACDENRHIECIGVRTSFGTLRGVKPGALDIDGAATEPLPEKPCDYLAGDCKGVLKQCDAESSISTVLVDSSHGPLRLVHVHPTAIGSVCLTRQVEQAFALADDLPTLIAGDWNFDPGRATDLVPASIWHAFVGPSHRFQSHDARIEDCRLPRTSAEQDASLDRVISDFARGVCKVWESPRLDDGFDFEKLDGARIDHLAVQCDLSWSVP